MSLPCNDETPFSRGEDVDPSHEDFCPPKTIRRLIRDIQKLDARFDLTRTNKLTRGNLAFLTMAAGGECGELENVAKKICRSGEKPELWAHFSEEMVDTIFYLLKIIMVTEMDFEAAWEKKIAELYQRYIDNPPKDWDFDFNAVLGAYHGSKG